MLQEDQGSVPGTPQKILKRRILLERPLCSTPMLLLFLYWMTCFQPVFQVLKGYLIITNTFESRGRG